LTGWPPTFAGASGHLWVEPVEPVRDAQFRVDLAAGGKCPTGRWTIALGTRDVAAQPTRHPRGSGLVRRQGSRERLVPEGPGPSHHDQSAGAHRFGTEQLLAATAGAGLRPGQGDREGLVRLRLPHLDRTGHRAENRAENRAGLDGPAPGPCSSWIRGSRSSVGRSASTSTGTNSSSTCCCSTSSGSATSWSNSRSASSGTTTPVSSGSTARWSTTNCVDRTGMLRRWDPAVHQPQPPGRPVRVAVHGRADGRLDVHPRHLAPGRASCASRGNDAGRRDLRSGNGQRKTACHRPVTPRATSRDGNRSDAGPPPALRVT
jgi:hypothetical protein